MLVGSHPQTVLSETIANRLPVWAERQRPTYIVGHLLPTFLQTLQRSSRLSIQPLDDHLGKL